eukprot:Protomagalhaensia_wolfi_Nauph_80__3695@NODE_372_length_2655_cov_397_597859_g280_i0_p1_GENE_NODE_372_length_2655_cov_397_597859_g280_i0NODE_372_length_2655_cov_397_597859_g280_i0_p1_ORF_typecomplete_len420_score32_66EI24/PF07264_11/4_6e07Chordopox_L2/PF05803_12/5_2Chordopox_L2/PF05803_12/33_NODE_372_length_2655_cov_397_597859_g280_i012662525
MAEMASIWRRFKSCSSGGVKCGSTTIEETALGAIQWRKADCINASFDWVGEPSPNVMTCVNDEECCWSCGLSSSMLWICSRAWLIYSKHVEILWASVRWMDGRSCRQRRFLLVCSCQGGGSTPCHMRVIKKLDMLTNPVVIVLETAGYCQRYWRVLLIPNLLYVAVYAAIHMMISRPMISKVVQYEKLFVDEVIYTTLFNSNWRMSRMATRFLRWTQMKWLTFVLARRVRQKWRQSFKSSLLELEGLKQQGVTLSYKKPARRSDADSYKHVGFIKHYLALGWFSTISSPTLSRLTLFLLSTPIHAIPAVGSYIYLYIHGGVKARRICAQYSRSQEDWDRLQRSRFCAKAARGLRPYAIILEFLEDCPIGCFLMPLLDLSVVLWMCRMKCLHQVTKLSVERIEARPAMKNAITNPSLIAT